MLWWNHAIRIIDEIMKCVTTPWLNLLKLNIVHNVFLTPC